MPASPHPPFGKAKRAAVRLPTSVHDRGTGVPLPRNGCSTSRNRSSTPAEIVVPLPPKYATTSRRSTITGAVTSTLGQISPVRAPTSEAPAARLSRPRNRISQTRRAHGWPVVCATPATRWTSSIAVTQVKAAPSTTWHDAYLCHQRAQSRRRARVLNQKRMNRCRVASALLTRARLPCCVASSRAIDDAGKAPPSQPAWSIRRRIAE